MAAADFSIFSLMAQARPLERCSDRKRALCAAIFDDCLYGAIPDTHTARLVCIALCFVKTDSRMAASPPGLGGCRHRFLDISPRYFEIPATERLACAAARIAEDLIILRSLVEFFFDLSEQFPL